jgi:DNA repair protein RadC
MGSGFTNGRHDLRERLRGDGPETMSESELLALLLGTGRRGERVADLAARLLARQPGLANWAELEASELEGLPGLGPARAARLVAAFEIGRRLGRTRIAIGSAVGSAIDAAQHVRGLLRDGTREEFHLLLLDARHRLLGSRLISVGTLQQSLVHPREVFRTAIRIGAAAVVVAHNHPSGDPEPSPEDRAVTERLRQVGDLVGILLLDHLVLGSGEFWSFAEGKRLPYR